MKFRLWHTIEKLAQHQNKRENKKHLLVSRILMAPFLLLIPVWDIAGEQANSPPNRNTELRLHFRHRE